ncbi:hypothetical protein [Actinophytocola sp. NPDC049390]|uniref:hypothetical protein n=1 Tax=Actinophytocola sp. NPDC049390 TaxID=3363894 RepID=UPI00378A4375
MVNVDLVVVTCSVVVSAVACVPAGVAVTGAAAAGPELAEVSRVLSGSELDTATTAPGSADALTVSTLTAATNRAVNPRSLNRLIFIISTVGLALLVVVDLCRLRGVLELLRCLGI